MSKRQLNLFIGLNRTITAIHRETETLFRQYDLTKTQFGVLEALYHKGDLTVGATQKLILTTSGNIPVVVKNLENRGLLERLPHPEDKRSILLHITEAGKSLIKEVFPQNEAIICRLINTWSLEEQDYLIQQFKKFGGVHNGKKN